MNFGLMIVIGLSFVLGYEFERNIYKFKLKKRVEENVAE